MRLFPRGSVAIATARLLLAALRGAIIGSFALSAGVAFATSGEWPRALLLPTEPALAIAIPASFIALMLGATLLVAALIAVPFDEPLLGRVLDRLPYSLLALVSVVMVLSATTLIHPELKPWLWVSLDGIQAEPWRLITTAATHMDSQHLGGNMLWTVMLAPSFIVLNIGGWRFWLALGLMLAASDCASLIWYPGGTQGFSGVLAGLSGFVVIASLRRIRSQRLWVMRFVYLALAAPGAWIVWAMIVWALASGTYHGAMVGHAVHIAGIAAGLAIGALLPLVEERRVKGPPPPEDRLDPAKSLEQVVA